MLQYAARAEVVGDSVVAGNGAQRSDRITRDDPVASLRYAPGCHLQFSRRRPASRLEKCVV